MLLTAGPAAADPAIDALVAAYPDFLAGSEGNVLIWKDGTRMPISDGRTGKSFEQLLNHPDIKDQFAIPYPLGIELKRPAVNEDPGRIRFQPFFLKMYGDCRKGEVTRHLKAVRWLPSGGIVMATTVNGVADKLAAVARELEKLPADLTRFMVPSAGTYNCRAIAKTHRLSRACLWCGDRSQRPQWRLLAVAAAIKPKNLEEPYPAGDRRSVRASRLHLGRQVVSLRHHAFRISPGVDRARQERLAAQLSAVAV